VLLAPTPRPGRPPAQPGVTTARARTTTPAPLVPIATSPPATTPAETGTFFRMASDWGSQFVGQEINYVIAFRNTRASDPINNLVISSDLPENLEILGRKADRGDPQIQGNTLTLKLDTLKAGQGVEIAVRTKIKDSVQVGTRILSQATASFDGLAVPLSSNVVTVLIVGADQSTAQPLIQAGSPTATASATATSAPSPTATETATATAEPATVAPQAASAPTVAPIAGQSPDLSAAPLPETSAGVPISGFLLLGLTLLLRTVRLHRAQSRI